MNKTDLVSEIAEGAGLSKVQAASAVDAFLQTITNTLCKGDEVRLVGFGTFYVSQREATEGRNPRTGEKIAIPARQQPKFRAGKTLKEILNS